VLVGDIEAASATHADAYPAALAVESGAYLGQEAGLTPREAEIIGLIAQGLNNSDITEKCSLSVNSVKSYIRSAYRKMDVSSRSQAVAWGVQHGFPLDSGS